MQIPFVFHCLPENLFIYLCRLMLMISGGICCKLPENNDKKRKPTQEKVYHCQIEYRWIKRKTCGRNGMRKRNKVFTPIFACSCVKMAAAAFSFLTRSKCAFGNEKNSAYRRCDKSVCSCVIQSRLKSNFRSISCGTFLNVSMFAHTTSVQAFQNW